MEGPAVGRRKPVFVNNRMEEGETEPIDQDLEVGTKGLLCAVDRKPFQYATIPGGPITTHRNLIEVEPPAHLRAACESIHQDIRINAMRHKLEELVNNDVFNLAELPAGP